MKLNELQEKALLRKWEQADQGMTYQGFKDTVQPTTSRSAMAAVLLVTLQTWMKKGSVTNALTTQTLITIVRGRLKCKQLPQT